GSSICSRLSGAALLSWANRREKVNDRMKLAATHYHDWLIKNKAIDVILRDKAELAELWPEGKDHAHLYGRPLAFYLQLQKLNLAAAWARVKVPALILHGQFDWIMTREDHELIAQYVNANRPGGAFCRSSRDGTHLSALPEFHRRLSWRGSSVRSQSCEAVVDWLNEHRDTYRRRSLTFFVNFAVAIAARAI